METEGWKIEGRKAKEERKEMMKNLNKEEKKCTKYGENKRKRWIITHYSASDRNWWRKRERNLWSSKVHWLELKLRVSWKQLWIWPPPPHPPNPPRWALHHADSRVVALFVIHSMNCQQSSTRRLRSASVHRSSDPHADHTDPQAARESNRNVSILKHVWWFVLRKSSTAVIQLKPD